VEEARQAYLALFNGDRPRADLLLRAMKQWASDRQANPAGVDAKQVEQFSQWVAQRETIHSQTAGATTSANLRTW
jgi:hypothetical protein